MAKSRITNTIYNFITNIGGQIITIILQFITRTVFIHTLGSSYLGINGLFTNLLSMLSLAELGVGSAILFKLYEPIAKQDTNRIKLLIKFYKQIYTIIGIAITIIGICLIPFLPFIINDYEKLSSLGINAIFIYLLYLLQTVSSYLFFAYKSAIVKANQKEYMINVISYIFRIITSIVQIVVLIFFHNFELYIIVLVINVIGENYAGAILANKLYPYIKEKTEDKIEKKEIKEIFKDCAAIFIYKINGVVLNATDNIVISIFLGLSMVGIYSNYYVLYTTINTIFSKIFDAVCHSLGNLHTTHNYQHEYTVFKAINLLSIILGATAGIGIFCVANEFVQNWIGEQWVLMQPFALLMGIEIYTLSIRGYLSRYRNTMGLFQQAKYRPLFGIIINIVISVILVKSWGICGVLIGTIIADWTTVVWYDPLIIHKYGFKNKFPIKIYYLKNLEYILITISIGIIDYIICSSIFLNFGWISVLIHACICAITVPIVFIINSLGMEEGKYIINLGKNQIEKIKRKVKNNAN